MKRTNPNPKDLISLFEQLQHSQDEILIHLEACRFKGRIINIENDHLILEDQSPDSPPHNTIIALDKIIAIEGLK